MLKQVQHDMTVRFPSFCHPELVSGSRFLVLDLVSSVLLYLHGLIFLQLFYSRHHLT